MRERGLLLSPLAPGHTERGTGTIETSFLLDDGSQMAATEKVLSTPIHAGKQESGSEFHFILMLGGGGVLRAIS